MPLELSHSTNNILVYAENFTQLTIYNCNLISSDEFEDSPAATVDQLGYEHIVFDLNDPNTVYVLTSKS